MSNQAENVRAKEWEEEADSIFDGLIASIKNGQEIDQGCFEFLCRHYSQTDRLRSKLGGPITDLPNWAKCIIIEANMHEIYRRNGDKRPFIEIFLEQNAEPPTGDEPLPLQAWTVMHHYFRHGGVEAGAKLPAWVWKYLTETSNNIQKLRSQMARTPEDRLKDVPQALGFGRGKKNVFAACWRAAIDSAAALIYETEGAKGAHGRARIEPVMDFLELNSDERTARRRVEAGRKTFRALPPWADSRRKPPMG